MEMAANFSWIQIIRQAHADGPGPRSSWEVRSGLDTVQSSRSKSIVTRHIQSQDKNRVNRSGTTPARSTARHWHGLLEEVVVCTPTT